MGTTASEIPFFIQYISRSDSFDSRRKIYARTSPEKNKGSFCAAVYKTEFFR